MPNWTHGLIVITWKRAERASQHFTAVVWFVELPNNSGVCCIASYRWWMVICDAQPLTLQRRPYSSQLQLGYTHTSVFCFLFLFQRNAFLRAFWKRLAMDWPSPSVCTRNESLCLTKAASLLAICRRLHVHPNERSTARRMATSFWEGPGHQIDIGWSVIMQIWNNTDYPQGSTCCSSQSFSRRRNNLFVCSFVPEAPRLDHPTWTGVL